MSGEIEDSDSWGSIIMDGVMNRMAKMTGLTMLDGTCLKIPPTAPVNPRLL